MSRIRTGTKPGQWQDQGPAAATVKAGHIQGSFVIGASIGSGNADGPRDDLANARRRASNAKRAEAAT